MTTATLAPPRMAVDRRTVLSGVSWPTYQLLSEDFDDRPGTRFAYNDGDLEIWSVSLEHEKISRTLAQFVEVIAEELGIDVLNAGSTTLARADVQKAVEPDTCFYIKNEPLMRNKATINPLLDPGPDLVIEVDLTSHSLNRFPIYLAMDAAEIWRFADGQFTIFVLRSGAYVEVPASEAISLVTIELPTNALTDSRTMPRTTWSRELRSKIRQMATAPPT